MDLALNNLQNLICHKTQTSKQQQNEYTTRDVTRISNEPITAYNTFPLGRLISLFLFSS